MRISKKIKQQVFERDGYKCKECGAVLEPSLAEIHHILPISKGGTNELSNLTTLCRNCNYSITDKIIDVATTPLSGTIADTWVKAFKKAPAITSILSLLLAIIGLVVGIYFNHVEKVKQEAVRKENLNYYNQIQQLDDTEKTINQLLDFVKDQRINLKSTQDSLESLKTEKEKLEPLVESDRKVVEALFQAQEERSRANISRERWIGFGLGVLASILASTILVVLKYFINRKKLHNNANSRAQRSSNRWEPNER